MPRSNQFLKDPDRQMSLASPDFADDQQALIAPRVAFLGEVRCDKMSLCQRRMGAREIGIVIREFAMLVSPWDAGSSQRSLGPGPQLAVAARHAPVVYDSADLCETVFHPVPSHSGQMSAEP